MSNDETPKGKPLALDRNATSASPIEPAFVARPKGAPVYYGFAVLEDVSADGFMFGAITDFEAEPTDTGDASSSLQMTVGMGLYGKSLQRTTLRRYSHSSQRWGVWAVSFPYPMDNRENARKNLMAVLPDLKTRWEEWKQWLSRRELSQLS